MLLDWDTINYSKTLTNPNLLHSFMEVDNPLHSMFQSLIISSGIMSSFYV